MQDAPQATETQQEIDDRLAQINAALAAAQSGPVEEKSSAPMAGCPIDPAERALCEGCQ